MWSRLILALALAATLVPAAQAQALRDNAKCEENPLFSRFAGEKLSVCERLRFAALELWVWKRPGDPKSGTEASNVEGETWNYLSEIERDPQGRRPSTLEVKRNFENAVRAAGGTLIGADGSTVSYRIVRADGEYWGRSGCGRGGDECAAVMHRIVRKAALAQQVGVLGVTPAAGGTAPGGQSPPPAAGGAASSAAGPGACNCACPCQGGAASQLDFIPALMQRLRPYMGARIKVPDVLTLTPARGTRGMLVHLVGPQAAAATAVSFAGVPAQISAVRGEYLSLVVPDVPSEAVSVTVQTAAGQVTLAQPFQVYQLPVDSNRNYTPPCQFLETSLALRITSLQPQRASPGAQITLTVPGLSVVQTRLQQERDAQAAAERRAAQGDASMSAEEKLLAVFGRLAGAMGGSQSGPDVLGVAFSYEPGTHRATGNAMLDQLARAASYQEPVVPVVSAGDTFSVPVPSGATSGPMALVLYRMGRLGDLSIHQCSVAGPDLIVAPPAALPPPRR